MAGDYIRGEVTEHIVGADCLAQAAQFKEQVNADPTKALNGEYFDGTAVPPFVDVYVVPAEEPEM